MDPYSAFAQVYDLFMDNIPYDDWCGVISDILHRYGIRDGIVADLGCGTGQLTRRLAAAGYDMIGVDASPEMLEIAYTSDDSAPGGMPEQTNSPAESEDILYLCQDLREMEFYGTVRAFVCVCDTMNYITEPEDMLTVFRLINNYLDPGSIFIFDINTDLFYNNIGDSTIAENRDEASFIWENEYDPESRENIYRMTFFIREETGLFRKYTEEHLHRAWQLQEMKDLLSESGLKFLEVLDADTFSDPSEDSERLLIVARESGKLLRE